MPQIFEIKRMMKVSEGQDDGWMREEDKYSKGRVTKKMVDDE